jgi:hypothetical protein
MHDLFSYCAAATKTTTSASTCHHQKPNQSFLKEQFLRLNLPKR